MSPHAPLMQKALDLAKKAALVDEVPVGAMVVDKDGNILSEAYNTREQDKDPLGHAELKAIQLASKKLNDWRLEDCTLYVTLEPCPMCLSAMREARIKLCVFGAYDSKGGALSLGYRMHQDPRLNHRFSIIGGIGQNEASGLLSDFFRKKRRS